MQPSTLKAAEPCPPTDKVCCSNSEFYQPECGIFGAVFQLHHASVLWTSTGPCSDYTSVLKQSLSQSLLFHRVDVFQ